MKIIYMGHLNKTVTQLLITVALIMGNLTFCIGKELLKIDEIKSYAYFGENIKPVEVEPLKETEKWFYGEFDPSQIGLNILISSDRLNIASIELFSDIKVGRRLYSNKTGIDVKHIEKTAEWRGKALLKRDLIKFKKAGSNIVYSYKFSLDDVFSLVYEKGFWPYIISFEIVVKQNGQKVVRKKNIMIIPDNKGNY